jgi:hypothetical protein
MFRSRIPTQLTALFVVAFVCLNASGAVCVAYCKGFDIKAEKEHCPLEQFSKHCNKKANRENGSKAINLPEGEMDCCPFTISFISAPVESQNASVLTAAATPIRVALPATTFVSNRKDPGTGTAYRGPPTDHRIERLKNCILRI